MFDVPGDEQLIQCNVFRKRIEETLLELGLPLLARFDMNGYLDVYERFDTTLEYNKTHMTEAIAQHAVLQELLHKSLGEPPKRDDKAGAARVQKYWDALVQRTQPTPVAAKGDAVSKGALPPRDVPEGTSLICDVGRRAMQRVPVERGWVRERMEGGDGEERSMCVCCPG
jgi:hypothetical protein